MRNDALKDPLAFVQRLQEGVSGLAITTLQVMVQLSPSHSSSLVLPGPPSNAKSAGSC